jgi:hypothetical protein
LVLEGKELYLVKHFLEERDLAEDRSRVVHSLSLSEMFEHLKLLCRVPAFYSQGFEKKGGGVFVHFYPSQFGISEYPCRSILLKKKKKKKINVKTIFVVGLNYKSLVLYKK